MNVIMILDQVQSGYGTKSDKMISLTGTKEIVGPGIIMKPYLNEIDAKIVATLYCGTGTYIENPSEVSRKLCGMVKRLKPDVVICGPSLSYADSASMCAKVAYDIVTTTNTKALAAISVDSLEVIDMYKDKVTIVKTPNKGESGLRESFKNICIVAKRLVDCV
ncbi:MAG: glycine/betaine/sarcosine/D-proline reductase family selenoprotein B [Clostridium baratii]|uniref:GrdB-related putative oxidoreductase n=1 Tax=Clostridium baratii TaxID=1561 RepID=UPI00242B46D9|nr:GrdB-related putative oxidoreductase [Clostridium baratii]MBS6043080.1 glycine/betaine/sarcosine/D-proline reductase family selenoprotein B [Clostridium baratii]